MQHLSYSLSILPFIFLPSVNYSLRIVKKNTFIQGMCRFKEKFTSHNHKTICKLLVTYSVKNG